MDDLDAYSRYLGRNPDGRGTLGAAALLPAELANEPSGEVKELRDWAVAATDASSPVSGADLLSRLPTKSAERMSKPETVALAQLLGHFGLGIEPDVRFGAAAITPATPVVFFRTGPQPPHSPTPAYAAATTLLHLATAVSAADGHVSVEEQRHLVTHLEASLHLTAGERARLEAHLRWLSATEIKLTGLKRRIEALTRPQREGIGDLLVTVAAADGVISPEEITSLTKIYKLLDLDPAAVHGRLHAHLTGAAARPAPAAGPVTVRPAGTPDAGYPIHEPQTAAATSSGAAQGGLALDVASIEAKFAETAAVSALLTDIFTDDEAPAPAPSGSGVRRGPRGDPPNGAGHASGGRAGRRTLGAAPGPGRPGHLDQSRVRGPGRPVGSDARRGAGHGQRGQPGRRRRAVPRGRGHRHLHRQRLRTTGAPLVTTDTTTVTERIRPRDRDAIINSLRAGVVPRTGQQHIQVGRARRAQRTAHRHRTDRRRRLRRPLRHRRVRRRARRSSSTSSAPSRCRRSWSPCTPTSPPTGGCTPPAARPAASTAS